MSKANEILITFYPAISCLVFVEDPEDNKSAPSSPESSVKSIKLSANGKKPIHLPLTSEQETKNGAKAGTKSGLSWALILLSIAARMNT